MTSPRRRVAFVTNAALTDTPQGLTSAHSAVRREIVASAKALQQRGVAVHIVSLKLWPTEQVEAIVGKADFVVFGSMLEAQDAAAYRHVLRALDGRRSVFIVGDEPSPFYDDVLPLAHACVARSPDIGRALRGKAECPVHLFPAPSESARGAPHVVRLGLRSRVASALAKRYRIGLDPWRLRLLWIGAPRQAGPLLAALPELEKFAAAIPVSLECLTDAGSDLERQVTPPGAATSARVRVTVGQRAIETVGAALEDCHLVVLPDADSLIDALQAGRFAIGGTPPSDVFRAFSWTGGPLVDGLRWFVRHPGRAEAQLKHGQAHVAKYHSVMSLGGFWMEVLGFAGVREAATLVGHAHERYAANDAVDAERLISRALEVDSSSAGAHHLLGNILHDKGTLDRAISCYRRALRLDPELAAAHNDLGTAYVAKGWFDEAVQCYSRALQLDAESSIAHANLGQTLLKLGRRREALPHIRAATRARFAHLVRRTLKISKRRSMP